MNYFIVLTIIAVVWSLSSVWWFVCSEHGLKKKGINNKPDPWWVYIINVGSCFDWFNRILYL